MQVPLLDLKIQYGAIRDEIEPVVREICDSQYFILGPKVASFEEKLAAYCGTGHAVGCASGSDALLLALMALDVKRDEEVLTTPYTFFATAGAVSRMGAVPVFLDIDPVTFNLDPAQLATFLDAHAEKRDGGVWNRTTGRRIGAVIPVHLYGQTADMSRILPIAEEWGLPVIEDAAQAIGSEDGQLKKRAGNMGAVGCFSFFPSKNLGAFGDGGALTTNDDVTAARLKSLRVHGESTRYYHDEVGFNSRLGALQAAVLEIKLNYLDQWTAGRQANAAYYNEAFGSADCHGILATPQVVNGNRHIFNQYVLRVKDRDGLVAHLREQGIGCAIYYPVPLHLQKCFADLGYREGDLPEAERAAKETIALPIYPELTTEQKDAVIQAILSFYH